MKLNLSTFSSPAGELLLVTAPLGQVRALDFSDHRRRLMNLLSQHYPGFEINEAPVPQPIAQALAGYFSGCITALENIPVATNGSPMQEAVWEGVTEDPGRHDDELWRTGARFGS
jgi:methylated-DNA-[protein]-cysteine S-methyltransferase